MRIDDYLLSDERKLAEDAHESYKDSREGGEPRRAMHTLQQARIERMEDGREYRCKYERDEERAEYEENQDGRGGYETEEEVGL